MSPAAAATASQRSIRRALSLIFCIMLLDISGLTMLYPVAPFIVQRYSPAAINLTLLSAIYAAAQFFAAPALGKLSDRWGRRRILLVCLVGSAAGYLFFGFGGALWILFLSRFIDGITGGNMSVASAYIADVSRPEERAKNFTLIGLAWGLGLILGPAMGAVTGQITPVAPAFIAAGLSLASAFLGWFLLPESLPVEKRETAPLHARDFNPLAAIGAMARLPGLGRLLVALGIFNLAFNGMNSTESLFIIRRFEAQPWQIGLLLTLDGAAIAGVQGLVPGWVPRFGERALAIACLLAQATGAISVSFNPLFGLAYAIIVLRSAASGFIFPTFNALTANRVSAQQLGVLMGVTTSLGSMMSILGPLWAGVVYDRILPGAPYWVAAALFVIAAGLLFFKPPRGFCLPRLGRPILDRSGNNASHVSAKDAIHPRMVKKIKSMRRCGKKTKPPAPHWSINTICDR